MVLDIETDIASKTENNRIASSSSEDDEPVQIKRVSLKKRINLSDDEEENDGENDTSTFTNLDNKPNSPEKSEHNSEESSSTIDHTSKSKAKDKKKKRIFMRNDSEESDNDETAERSASRLSKDDHTSQQQRILESLRSDNGYDAESSGDDMPVNHHYSPPHYSGNEEEDENDWGSKKSKASKRSKPPSRKSAAACLKAMQEERLKIISESQRMVRESKASLPYHKPKQRSLTEFLKARPQPSPILRGTKYQQVAIELIGEELEKCEKMAEEFYKAESDEERLTPPPQTPEPPLIPVDKELKVVLTDQEGDTKNIQPATDSVSQSELLEDVNDTEDTSIPLDSASQHISSVPDTDSAPSITLETNKTTSDKNIIPDTPDSEFDSCHIIQEVRSQTSSDNEIIPDTPDLDIETSSATTIVDSIPKPVSSSESKKNISDTPSSEVDSCTVEQVIQSESVETKNTENVKKVIKDTPDSGIESFPTEQTVVSEKNDTNPIQISDSSQSKELPKLVLSIESTDACLTPSDALQENDIFLKPADKTGEKVSDALIENSMDTDTDDFHLVFEDTDDIVKDYEEISESKTLPGDDNKLSPQKEEAVTKKSFDLTKLYNSSHLVDDDDDAVTPKPELKGKAKMLAKLKLSSGPIRLSGSPNQVIDLDDSPSTTKGVGDLMQRFMKQYSTGVKKPAAKEGILKLMQEGDAIDEAPDLKDKPGVKMSMLKSELRQSLARLRDEEFRRRQREYQLYEDETGELVGDDAEGKILSDEEIEMETEEATGHDAVSEAGSTETEPELEDDVEMVDKPLPRSDFMDDEAEESEHEDDQEDPTAAEEVEEDENEDEEEESEGEESQEEQEDESAEKENENEENLLSSTPSSGKCKFQRIKKVDDSDEEPEPTGDIQTEVKNLCDNVSGQPDTQPIDEPDDASEKDKSFASVCNDSFNLSILESADHVETPNCIGSKTQVFAMKRPITDLKFPHGLTQLFETQHKVDERQHNTQLSPLKNPIAPEGLGKLIQHTDSVPDDLGALCSGQFPISAAVPEGIDKLVQHTYSVPDDLGALCSGQFPTSVAVPEGIDKLIQHTDSVPDDLGVLCSGHFPTSVAPDGIEKLVQHINSDPDDLEALCSGQFPETQPSKKIPSPLKGLVGGVETQTQDLAMLCSGQFITQNEPENANTQTNQLKNSTLTGNSSDNKDKPKNLDKLFSSSISSYSTNLEDLCSGQFVTQVDVNNSQASLSQNKEDSTTKNKVPDPSSNIVEMRIVSDDEDGEDAVLEAGTRKGKRKLAFSDDEEEPEPNAEEDGEEELVAEESEVEEDFIDDDNDIIEYDSEENEVVSKPQNFFEAEAELSGEENWGSADEDEAGLDELEEELGDKEVIDEEQLASQLGKIHARRLLDDDKRDVRLFQEAFLEDGDLHSENGGRQRLYRWKNTDDGSWATGARPDMSGDEAGDEEDEETESAWRSARLERETWLQQNKDKMVQSIEEDSQLLQMGRSLLAKMGTVRVKQLAKAIPETEKPNPKSPGKAILHALKGKSGSFLGRRSISLSRVVALTGTEGEAGCMVNTSNRNFVFTSLSPDTAKDQAQPLDDSITEEASPQQEPIRKKRPMKTNPLGQQPAAKKKKVSTSLFQLLQ